MNAKETSIVLTPSLSIVMPALNEERNLEAAVRTVEKVIPPYFPDWELLIFNDGSSDRTGEIAEALAKNQPRIRVFHHASPKNLGGVYREGIRAASKNYLVMIPGDNENGSSTLSRIFERVGRADIIIPYVVNSEVRPWRRRQVSNLFVWLVNLISGCRLRYYNGTVLHKTELLKRCLPNTDGFGYQAEILVRLIRKGASYEEVGVELACRPNGGSKAFSLDNVLKVFRFLSTLAWQLRRSEGEALPA